MEFQFYKKKDFFRIVNKTILFKKKSYKKKKSFKFKVFLLIFKLEETYLLGKKIYNNRLKFNDK